MNCSTPSFPVFHYLPEFAQTQVHWVNDAIQPSHPLSPPSLPALNLSKHQGLLMNRLFTTYDQGIGASASVPPMNIQGWFPLGLTCLIFLQFKGLSRVFSNFIVRNHQFFHIHIHISHFMTQLSKLYMTNGKTIMQLCWQSDVSAFLICCLGWS